ncbi:MAG: hypothetical protein ABIS50_15720 [Luteolibacter sp.]|uniref:hypothetical protein n=1 Tax=Luteolibacter sp. TaxID=1962973 RepID=UPI003264D1D4
MENEEIRNQYEAYTRINAFGEKYGAQFDPTSRGRKQFTQIDTVVAKMVEHGVKKLTGKSGFHGGTGGKELAAQALRVNLRKIRKTSVSIAEEEDMPEFDDKFVLPRSASYEVLLTRARSVLQEATPHAALFVEFELAANFLDTLDKSIKRLENAGTDQRAGLSDQVGATAELVAAAVEGMKIRKQLLTLVRNKFENNVGVLAEWETANHIVWPTNGGNGDAAPPSAEA